MNTSRREQLFDLAFLVGVFFKGVNGLLELLIGAGLLFTNSAQLTTWAHQLTRGELGEDRRDLMARLIMHATERLSSGTITFVSAYLLVHGLVKVVLVIALVRGSTKVYPWAVGALSLFLVFQGYELIVHPSVGIALLAIFDAVIIALTLREWRHGRPLKETIRTTLHWLRHPRAVEPVS